MKTLLHTPTVIEATLQRARVIFFILVISFYICGITTLFVGLRSGELRAHIIQPLQNRLHAFVELLNQTDIEVDTLKDTELPDKTPITPPIPSASPTMKKTPTIVQPKKPCYRYTVTHLDGSTSNRCYSQSDYNQLVQLGYKLSSAKTFYEFHLQGAQTYQDQYDRTHSSIYLDAKASQESQAKRQQEIIGQVTLQMQQIESRGY